MTVWRRIRLFGVIGEKKKNTRTVDRNQVKYCKYYRADRVELSTNPFYLVRQSCAKLSWTIFFYFYFFSNVQRKIVYALNVRWLLSEAEIYVRTPENQWQHTVAVEYEMNAKKNKRIKCSIKNATTTWGDRVCVVHVVWISCEKETSSVYRLNKSRIDADFDVGEFLHTHLSSIFTRFVSPARDFAVVPSERRNLARPQWEK